MKLERKRFCMYFKFDGIMGKSSINTYTLLYNHNPNFTPGILKLRQSIHKEQQSHSNLSQSIFNDRNEYNFVMLQTDSGITPVKLLSSIDKYESVGIEKSVGNIPES
jgi:hypothetical protein